MICWNDFVLDDFIGPLLNLNDGPVDYKVCRRKRLGDPTAKDGGRAKLVQETGQTYGPARMVGLSATASKKDDAPLDMDVVGSDRAKSIRQGGKT